MSNLIILVLFCGIVHDVRAQFSSHYFKLYHSGYSESFERYHTGFSAFETDYKSRYSTVLFDATLRVSNKWQNRISLTHTSVVFQKKGLPNTGRSGLTDLWVEQHYYFSQYPNKRFVGMGLKIPLGYNEKQDPWLANGAYEIRLRIVDKTQYTSHTDVEIDLSIDSSLSDSERIKTFGFYLPMFLALNYTMNPFTFQVNLYNEFKSYRYVPQEDFSSSFASFLGLRLKYQISQYTELEFSASRSFIGVESQAASILGFGVSYGKLD